MFGEKDENRRKSLVLDAKLEMREGARPKRSDNTRRDGVRGLSTSEIGASTATLVWDPELR